MAPNGVEIIRNALLQGLDAVEGANVEITCIGSPKYRVVITADEYKDAEEIMKKVSNKTINALVAAGGEASLKRETK